MMYVSLNHGILRPGPEARIGARHESRRGRAEFGAFPLGAAMPKCYAETMDGDALKVMKIGLMMINVCLS